MLIHVDPPSLYRTAVEMDASLMEIWERISALRRQMVLLEMNWYGGPQPEVFHDDFRRTLQVLDAQAEALNQLCALLRRQAAAWEESDLEWAGRMEALTFHR